MDKQKEFTVEGIAKEITKRGNPIPFLQELKGKVSGIYEEKIASNEVELEDLKEVIKEDKNLLKSIKKL